MEPILPRYSIPASQNHVVLVSTIFSVTGSQMSELKFSETNPETFLTLSKADTSKMATS